MRHLVKPYCGPFIYLAALLCSPSKKAELPLLIQHQTVLVPFSISVFFMLSYAVTQVPDYNLLSITWLEVTISFQLLLLPMFWMCTLLFNSSNCLDGQTCLRNMQFVLENRIGSNRVMLWTLMAFCSILLFYSRNPF